MVLPNRHKRIASAKARARKGLPPFSRAPRSTPGQSLTAAPEEEADGIDSELSASSEADDGEADEGDVADAESDEEDLESAAFERA